MPIEMLFRSYIGPYLPSGEQLHIVKVKVQWWRCANVLYSVALNTMAKPVTKTPHGQEQCHMNGHMLGRLQGQAKLPTGAPIWPPLEFSTFAKRLFYESPTLQIKRLQRWGDPYVFLANSLLFVKSHQTHTHTHTTHTTSSMKKKESTGGPPLLSLRTWIRLKICGTHSKNTSE